MTESTSQSQIGDMLLVDQDKSLKSLDYSPDKKSLDDGFAHIHLVHSMGTGTRSDARWLSTVKFVIETVLTQTVFASGVPVHCA